MNRQSFESSKKDKKINDRSSKCRKLSKNDDDEDEEEQNDLDTWNDNNDIDDINYEMTNLKDFDETTEFVQWARPKLFDMDTENTPLIFQQIDIDHYVTIGDNPKPIFRFYGINKAGNSIVAHVHDFYPYFYTEIPENFKPEDCSLFKTSLNDALKETATKYESIENLIVDIEYCMKAVIYGFKNNEKIPYLKVILSLPTLIPTCRRTLNEGFYINGYGYQNLHCFDTDIDFTIRFMVDSGLVGCGWVEFPVGKYTIRQNYRKSSLCQLEVDISWKEIIYHSPEIEWSDMAPMRILSFDIECANRKGFFPKPEIDNVIQISNIVTRFGETEPFIKNIFTLNSCAPIVGADVLPHNTEVQLLTKWSQFIRDVDPDIITGYNMQNFDLPFLINRAAHLNVNGFSRLGRMKGVPSRITESMIQSKQMGRRKNKVVQMSGRVQFDLLLILYRDHKLRSYSLNAASYHFLEEQKDAVSHQIISDLQSGDDKTRRRLAVYCLKDSELVLRLMSKLMIVVNYIEMARVTGIPLSYVISRGQQVKVLSQLLRKAATEDFILPDYTSNNEDEFSGGTVIEPEKGFYPDPIAILDFASLYPSIMMAHNLCYTTLIKSDDTIRKFGLTPDQYTETPCGSRFVKSSVKRGLLPEILVQLLDARKKAKRELSTETDPFKKQVLDGRQLALKLSANSVYGFTGAQVGRLPCLLISSSVTGFGREMIQSTKDVVEITFKKSNGYAYDAKVIYGDTDSVMCHFGVKTVAEAMVLGKKAAEIISDKFISPIKIEFEKVYFPYLLISKKRYAGMYYSKADKFDKMECKGIETVRRDNCPLVSDLVNNCLKRLLISGDKNAALEHAQTVISDLLCDRVDIAKLIISKELTKSGAEYTVKQPHCELAEKMKKRDIGSAPKLGDRVPYVITTLGDKTKLYTRAEDPIYVLENNVPIDTDYYLKNQLINPLMRLFEPIFGKETANKKLIYGEHMMSKTKQKTNVSIMSKYMIVKPTCIGCRNVLKTNEKSFCEYCMPSASKIYQKELLHLSTLVVKFNGLWTQCQRCSGSLLQEVLCTSRDCPIFYMRMKVRKDLMAQDEVIQRLEKDLEW